MDLADVLDRELVPESALVSQKGTELVGEVVEHQSCDVLEESGDENATGYLCPLTGASQHELSPFGMVYSALSQLTTWETVCALNAAATSSDVRDVDDSDVLLGNRWRQTILDKVMEGLEHLKAVFRVEDATDKFSALLKRVVGSFRRPLAEIELTERSWITFTLVILTESGVFPHEEAEVDAAILEREILSHYNWSPDAFRALSSVFDAERFTPPLS